MRAAILCGGRGTLRLDAIAETIALAAPREVDIVYGDGTDAFRAPFTVATDRLASLGWHPSGDIAVEAQRCVAIFSSAVANYAKEPFMQLGSRLSTSSG
jgi:UDP-glucose 4-epimerase